ncbi:glutathione S-transferase [Delitschia confertaspora ATCC 74209]|uniref:Glutathione S-transferase n=1 Tax=Delitschia confertaspora ATCC 74209 TaxID=1513339 RepID=A0A9P4JFK1_9PLEO|nr:glutathione S-transferase [Delitschia confertaspora ATCC 74209]
MTTPDRSNLKPISLWWRPQTPNPAKVVIILEELRLPYTGKFVELEDLKKAEFEAVNPNGRVPAIHDPNTNITLWESAAIISYLIATYDTTHTLTYTDAPNAFHLQQWAYFQASGQGPYFGQAAWFLLYHPEPLPSAKDRYVAETRRVVGVLDKWLGDRTREGNVWLVGNKMTYADLMFVTWNGAVGLFLKLAGREGEWDPEKEFPHFWKWQNAMMARSSFQKAMSLAKVEDVHN